VYSHVGRAPGPPRAAFNTLDPIEHRAFLRPRAFFSRGALVDALAALKCGEELDATKRATVKGLMSAYRPGPDLDRYKFFVGGRYTRNLVALDPAFSLVLMCWSAASCSPVHDHPTHGCWMKVLEGELTETLYRKDEEAHSLV